MTSARERLARLSPVDRSRGRRAHAPAKLAHFVMKTARLNAMVNWYRAVLDAEVVFENDRLAFLTYDLEHHRIAFVRMPRAIGAIGALTRYLRKLHGLDHIAFTYATLAELVTTYRRLREHQIEPVWCINHGPTTSMYYEDPDGHRLELQSDNFDSLEELATFMDSGDFARNPIGVEFDPELLAQRLDEGVPLADLVRRESGVRPGTRPVAGYHAIRWKTL